jgi:hypothetical protein
MGKRREEIMNKCPEDFEYDLKDFIDSVENELTTIRDMMEVTSISELDKIDDAHSLLTDLCDELF